MNRRELAKKFIENELSDNELVDLYNTMAERNSYERIYPNDEATIDDLICTEGKTAVQIWGEFDNDYNTVDDYVMYNGLGYLESFNDPKDQICISELVDDFLESDWCNGINDDFSNFVADAAEEEGLDDDIVTWLREECFSDLEWEDEDDLFELYNEYKNEQEDDDED